MDDESLRCCSLVPCRAELAELQGQGRNDEQQCQANVGSEQPPGHEVPRRPSLITHTVTPRQQRQTYQLAYY